MQFLEKHEMYSQLKNYDAAQVVHLFSWETILKNKQTEFSFVKSDFDQ